MDRDLWQWRKNCSSIIIEILAIQFDPKVNRLCSTNNKIIKYYLNFKKKIITNLFKKKKKRIFTITAIPAELVGLHPQPAAEATPNRSSMFSITVPIITNLEKRKGLGNMTVRVTIIRRVYKSDTTSSGGHSKVKNRNDEKPFRKLEEISLSLSLSL